MVEKANVKEMGKGRSSINYQEGQSHSQKTRGNDSTNGEIKGERVISIFKSFQLIYFNKLPTTLKYVTQCHLN